MRIESPINESTAAQHCDALPASADVVIIGAGIAGICTALTLAERGVSVLVCEKGRVGCEQSSRNWGWIRQTGRDEDEYPIMVESLRHWKEMAARTGENCLSFQEQGVLYVSESDADEEKYEKNIGLAKQHEVDSKLLSRAEIKALAPNTKKDYRVALHTPSDGRVEPWSAVPALARAVTRAGGTIIENCAARGIETANGEVSEVVTEKGSVKTSQVLLAGGAWSSLLAESLGIALPQLSVKATVARFDCDLDLYAGNIKDKGLAVCKRMDGGYNMALTDHQTHYIGPNSFRYLKPFAKAIKASFGDTRFGISASTMPDPFTQRSFHASTSSPFERTRVLDPQAEPSLVNQMVQRLRERFHGEDSVTVTHAWAGMIDTMPDFVPVLDHCADLPGLSIATGFSGHGFGIGPGAATVMADLIQGKTPQHDLSRFRYQRFTDRTPIKLGPL